LINTSGSTTTSMKMKILKINSRSSKTVFAMPLERYWNNETEYLENG